VALTRMSLRCPTTKSAAGIQWSGFGVITEATPRRGTQRFRKYIGATSTCPN